MCTVQHRDISLRVFSNLLYSQGQHHGSLTSADLPRIASQLLKNAEGFLKAKYTASTEGILQKLFMFLLLLPQPITQFKISVPGS